MKKIWAVVILFLLCGASAFAQEAASSSFDDRPTCEKQKGVWREFGNGCIDECYPKFDKFTICTSAITFGCDCGKGRCWDNKSCVPVTQYKKTFDKNFEEEQKTLQEAKKKRQAEYQANSGAIVEDLISKKQSSDSVASQVQGAIKNNYNDFYKNNITPAINDAKDATDSAITAANKNLEKAGQEQLPQITLPMEEAKVPTAPPIVIDSNNAPVPALFLEQQKTKTPTAPQTIGNSQNTNSQSHLLNNINTQPGNAAALPIIPLPQ